MSEDAFFAVPPAGEEIVGDAPIVLGPPQDDPFAAPPPDYSSAPAETTPAAVGDVTEAVVTTTESSSPMQIWNNEWQETLKTRKDEEAAKKAEYLEAARVALAQFEADREAQRESTMTKNREDEQTKLEAIEADLENDTSWQRVCKLVELQHDSSSEAQDVKRMRDVMIMLKNEPTKAQALSA